MILDAIEERADLTEAFGKLILEQLAALRGIVSSVMYDLATQASLNAERMNQIITHAEQTKFERAAQIINQLLKRQPDTHHE